VTACGNSYTKSIWITYKSYKQILYFGLPGNFPVSQTKVNVAVQFGNHVIVGAKFVDLVHNFELTFQLP